MCKKFILFLILMMFVPFVYATQVDSSGFSFIPVTKTSTVTTGNSTDTVVWTPASGSAIVLMGMKFSSATAGTILVESGTTAVIPTAEYTASGLMVVSSYTPIWQGAEDETLTYTTVKSGVAGSSGRHSILLWGYEKE